MPKMTPAEALATLTTMTDDDFPTIDPTQDIDETQAARLIEAGRKTVGRPSLTAPGTHSPQLTLRLPEAMNIRLNDAAMRTGRRRSDIAREALEQYLSPTRPSPHHDRITTTP
ncbi:MAG: ribbon-helix-helix domain-containing protein [Bifidobacteriaceae bacterium]|jgi:hypothetical protein|nr:ribbon-helix-helix domain-containing protein [Bifidobacteriaceae bacterium]